MSIQIDDKTYTLDELAALAKAGVLQLGQKSSIGSSATPNAVGLHGPIHGSSTQFGIFSDGTVRPGRYSALQRTPSLMSIIPLFRSDVANERIGILTGQQAATGSPAAGFCQPAPVPGNLKTCVQSVPYGEVHIQTQIASVMDTGLRRDRAEVDSELYNQAAQVNPWIPYSGELDSNDLFRTHAFRVGIQVERDLTRVLHEGVAGASSATYPSLQKQFRGLDGWIKTGYTDVDSSVACPAADSVVYNHNAAIDAVGAGTGTTGQSIVVSIHALYWAVNSRAIAVGMGGTQWAFAVHPQMWPRLAQTYACEYATNGCLGTAAAPNNRDGMEIQRMRQEMYAGRFLWVDGERVPVVMDEGIPLERPQAGTLRAGIKLVPISWNAQPLLYGEFFPVDNGQAVNLLSALGARVDDVVALNNGLYLAALSRTKACVEWSFMARVRLILDAPFLAGRIDNITFAQVEGVRVGDPAITYAYADGGVTYLS